MSHFEAVYGYPPPRVPSYLPGSSPVHLVDTTLRDRDALLRQLRENLHLAQECMRHFANKKRSEREFQVGDWVFLRLQPYLQSSVSHTNCPKLAPRFYGPYQILARVGKVAYILDLPANSRIHPTFHVSLLKPKLGSHVIPSTILPPLSDTGLVAWTLETILQRGMFKRGNSAVTRWLIKWVGLPDHDATWEDADSIIERFPDFHA
ncbi:unnamed protein product [Malus baccata var. baccata]